MGMPKEDWVWAEVNAFHSADVARQLLDDVNGKIGEAEYLRKKERGEIDADKFKEIWAGLKKDVE